MTLKKPNIKDIALKTDLSISTVSRVLNGKSKQYRIGKKSQKKIEGAAKELNYIPNYFAANLKSNKTNTIGLIVPNLNNPFFATIASKINIELRNHGYTTIIGDTNENVKIEKMELNQFVSRNIEGLIIVPCGNEKDHIKQIYDQGLPLILIDRYFEDLDVPYVSTDNFDGAVKATKLLIEHGHTAISCIQGIKRSIPNQLRVKGFKYAMKEAGIADTMNVVGDDFSIQNGFLETKMLLQKKERPTAIFTLSNTIAMGCLKALKQENILIPEDISIITFDNHENLDYLATPITSIAQPVEDICKIATKYLLSKLNDQKADTITQVILKPEIKHRKSITKIDRHFLL
jgi:LacI family transcriptional regulator